MDDDHIRVPEPEHERQRTALRQWGQAYWNAPCEALFFRWKRFHLDDFTGRAELGTRPLWYRISIVLAVPLLLLHAWCRAFLNEMGILDEGEKKPARPGAISVRGSSENPAPTSLIDGVKRAPRSLWIVAARSGVALVVAEGKADSPRVVWRTDLSARVRLHPATVNSVEITWPDKCRVSLYPGSAERQILGRFVTSTRRS